LILDLKGAGHRVVCGSNTFERHYLYHLERGEYAVFDRVYASHLIKVAKPSPAFYRHILEAEGWAAAETYFVDDREANVASARGLGIHALLYESFAGLEAWLAGRKLLPQR
jgi:FMN phosphatase YigB (HAD superfamily)